MAEPRLTTDPPSFAATARRARRRVWWRTARVRFGYRRPCASSVTEPGGMIVGVRAAPEVIEDPGDPRVADFRDLVAGDRRPGTPRGTEPVIVKGVPAVQPRGGTPHPAPA